MIDQLRDESIVVHLLLVAALSTRATILIVVDKAGRPVRWLLGHAGSWGRYLSGCPWCVGVWTSAAAVTAWIHAPGPTLVAGLACASALGAGVWGAWLKSSLPPPAE